MVPGVHASEAAWDETQFGQKRDTAAVECDWMQAVALILTDAGDFYVWCGDPDSVVELFPLGVDGRWMQRRGDGVHV